jgi:methyl acetate hydrolase
MHRLFFAAAVTLSATCSGTRQGALLDAETAHALDDVLQQAVQSGRVPGVVALVVDRDSVRYHAAFGVMDELGQEPMQEDAIFQIFSMTKPITSVGVMMLVEAGLIGLDDPASMYLSELADREVLVSITSSEATVTTRPAARPLTVRDLLRHTSGIAYTFSSNELLGWAQATGRPVLEQPLLHDPGARWTYGSSTYFLGRIIEQVTGEALDRFLDSRIFGPLGMAETSYELPPEKADRLVALYRRIDGQLAGEAPPESYRPNLRGDGGLLSTSQDYARFVQLILRQGEVAGVRLLSVAGVAEMSRDQLEGLTVTTQPGAIPATSNAFPLGAGRDGFGLGFQVAAGVSDGRAPGSLSWAGLRNTHFWVDPASGIGVVFLTQLLPFYDDSVIAVLRTFERTLYGRVR